MCPAKNVASELEHSYYVNNGKLWILESLFAHWRRNLCDLDLPVETVSKENICVDRQITLKQHSIYVCM